MDFGLILWLTFKLVRDLALVRKYDNENNIEIF